MFKSGVAFGPIVELKQKPSHKPPAKHQHLQVLLDQITLQPVGVRKAVNSAQECVVVSSTAPTVVPSGPRVVAGSSAGASSSSSSVPLQSAGRRQLRLQQSTDSDCQFVPFDFKTLRDLDFFDDDVPAVAEVVDEPSPPLAICDTEMAQPVDPADDALALQLESGDVHVPSAPGLTCPRCTDDREPPDHNNFDLDTAWQH